MPFNYRKLRGRIVEIYGSQMAFAKAMGFSERTLSLKLSGRRSWRQAEICIAIELLGLSENDIKDYFFTLEVQNIERKGKEVV